MSSVSFKASFGKGMHVCLNTHLELGNVGLLVLVSPLVFSVFQARMPILSTE